jgi:serine/threonine-protein kinase
VDARSDLYSTGCVLYELLTGRPPFSGDSPVAIAYQHVRENPVPPSQVDPEIPPWVDAIVLKAMAKSPADRYQNAAEMRADIQHAMPGLHASPPAAEMPRQTQRQGGQTVAAPPTTAIPGYHYGEGAEPPGGNRVPGTPHMVDNWTCGLALRGLLPSITRGATYLIGRVGRAHCCARPP